MEHIRPHQALGVFKTSSYHDRLVNVVLPDGKAPMSLESMILVALAKYVRPKVVFEFGTYLGITTLNFAANLGEGSIIYTFDLDKDTFNNIRQHPNDRTCSMDRFALENQLAFVSTPYESRIRRLFGDSNIFDFAPYHDKVNMIYIDGGHDLRTVRSDTQNAFSMLDTGRIGCIAWHDYRNPEYPELTQFLDDLSSEHELKHVEETMTVFTLHQT